MNEIAETIVAAPDKDDCNIAMLAHLLGIFTGFLGALVVWLVKKESSAYIAQESVEALNFQLTVMIGYVICSVLTVVLIGIVMFPLLYIVNIVFCILGAVASSKGTGYRYPFALRLIK